MAGCSVKLQRVLLQISALLTRFALGGLFAASLAVSLVTNSQLAFAQPGPEPSIINGESSVVTKDSVRQNVEQFHAALLTSAQMDGEFVARAPIIAVALDALFDIERIARISAGRSWRDLDGKARAHYVGLLRDVVIATYVSRFDADRGQRFETVGVNEVKVQRFVVKTRINRPNRKAVTLDYYFRGGRVFNVVADGVSDLSVRRADYGAVVKASGFEGLLVHLQAQLAAARENGSRLGRQTVDNGA